MLKSNLSKIPRRRYKSEEQKDALENIELVYESREAVIKLFNDYSSIASEVKFKTKKYYWKKNSKYVSTRSLQLRSYGL